MISYARLLASSPASTCSSIEAGRFRRAERQGDRALGHLECLRELDLGETALLHEGLVGVCLFHRLEVFAEDVFHALVDREFVRGGFAAHHETGDGFDPREERAALHLRSPTMTRYTASPSSQRTRIGWSWPRVLRLAASRSRAPGSKSVRGWFGSGAIRSVSMRQAPLTHEQALELAGGAVRLGRIGLRPPRERAEGLALDLPVLAHSGH